MKLPRERILLLVLLAAAVPTVGRAFRCALYPLYRTARAEGQLLSNG